MSPIVKSPECTPVLCHCKVACTNNTLSLMFGCKKAKLTASTLRWLKNQSNRQPAVQGSPHNGQPQPCMNPALMNAPWQYHYQEDDSPPLDQGFPRLTNEVRAPELVHVSEKNLSEIENVHGYVSHSHISPLKVLSQQRAMLAVKRIYNMPAVRLSCCDILVMKASCGGISLSRDAQTSLTPDTSSSSSGGIPRHSQASQET
ncbi:hypothetical protein L3Q82_006363 [Scortum barcoo]|uniref:Uncharacterized protein n=1 Tax=Scortum barcoo TaxID=214431 RepID=A0ACB8WZN8_9TELE|nr:hypothetical protein L3Q82_006363 [Scortum barcoo]